MKKKGLLRRKEWIHSIQPLESTFVQVQPQGSLHLDSSPSLPAAKIVHTEVNVVNSLFFFCCCCFFWHHIQSAAKKLKPLGECYKPPWEVKCHWVISSCAAECKTSSQRYYGITFDIKKCVCGGGGGGVSGLGTSATVSTYAAAPHAQPSRSSWHAAAAEVGEDEEDGS